MSSLKSIYESKYARLSDKGNAHTYIDYYEEILKSYRSKVIDLLEIGVKKGGSLKLWHDYFENGNIYGIDVNKSKHLFDGYPRVKTYRFDATSLNDIEKNINMKFDIIIDDGAHTLVSQIFAINFLLPKLKKDGIFIIEDVKDIDKCKSCFTNYELLVPSLNVEIVDRRNIKNSNGISLPDDALVILRYNKE